MALEYKGKNSFFKKSWNPIVFRLFALLVFLLMILILYLGSLSLIVNFNDKLVMFLVWTLWWPLLYISIFLLGRTWCGFICPIGLVNEIGNSARKTKKDPLLVYKFLPFVVFFIIVFWEQISGLFTSTGMTLLFLLTFFISAFILGIIIPRWGFCNHFCPIGALFIPFSRLSLFGVRTDKEICEKCHTKECLTGKEYPKCPMFTNVPNIKSNSECLMCLNCIKNCPYDSAKIVYTKPGKELYEKTRFNLSESLFIIALLGFSTLLTSKGNQIFRIFDFLNTSLLRGVDFIFAIGFFIGSYIILTLVYSKLYKSNFKENLTIGGYVFLPLAFGLMFFSIVFGFLTPLTKVSGSFVSIAKYSILLIGGFWSSHLAYRLLNKKSWLYVLAVVAIVLFWVFVLIPGPLNKYPIEKNIYIANDGEIVNMRAFSMGFDPQTIKIKKDSSFYLNITNVDIIHAFDLDINEFGVHTTLRSGESKMIRIVASKKGEYEFFCGIPGHEEAGMKGVLIVEE